MNEDDFLFSTLLNFRSNRSFHSRFFLAFYFFIFFITFILVFHLVHRELLSLEHIGLPRVLPWWKIKVINISRSREWTASFEGGQRLLSSIANTTSPTFALLRHEGRKSSLLRSSLLGHYWISFSFFRLVISSVVIHLPPEEGVGEEDRSRSLPGTNSAR